MKKTKIEGMDYFVRYIDFGNTQVCGAITSNPDGTANIYINTRLSFSQMREALEHEIDHLEREDLFRELDVFETERGMCC